MLKSDSSASEARSGAHDHAHTFRVESEPALLILHELKTTGELEKGCATILALDVVADRLGERWQTHRETVYQQTERVLYRHLAGQGEYMRISPLKYLLVVRGGDRRAAHFRTAVVLRQVLSYFFGAPRAGELNFYEATGLAAHTLFAIQIDAMRAEFRGASTDDATGRLARYEDHWMPFTVADGRRVRVGCSLDPVYQIRTSQRIGYHLSRWLAEMPTERRLTADEQRAFARTDIERIDFTALDRGLESLRMTAEEREPSLILPVSYTTLSNHKARTDFIAILRRAQEHVRHGLICEVCNIEGVPASGLLAACSPIRPFCRFIVGHLEARPRGSLAAIQEAALQGVSIDFPWADAGDTDFITWMRTLMAAVRPIAKTAIVYQLDSLRHAAMSALMGVSHASIRPSLPKPDELDVMPSPRRGHSDETEQQMRLWLARDVGGGAS